MILYHYTTVGHLPEILEDGYLDTTESNMSRTRGHAGPDVCWLTADSDPVTACGQWRYVPLAPGLTVDKGRIRFAVDVAFRDVHRWRDWVRARGIHPEWARSLARAGGSGQWFVVQRRVPRTEWVEVTDTVTGEVYDLTQR